MENRTVRICGSQADTYIEKKFEEACMELANGDKILNEWRTRKEQYISYTDLIILDFQHYSVHDVSHSLKILEAVELILGEDRVDLLSAGDLWLLLEAVYFHDIGMAITYDDLVEIWESSDFKQYLESNSVQSDPDLKEAKNLYMQMDNLVHDREKMYNLENEEEFLLDDKWPVELERKLVFLVTAYVRKDHARRCRKYLERFGSNDRIIQKRLYQIASQITVAHGESFAYLLNNLKQKSQGFGMDYVHPQFIAALLRLGDLLDMDNNRFNLRVLEHYGDIPWSSMVHLRKHRAMTHILICRERIEAEAEDEDMEVCRITRNWFQFIEQEVTDLICYWSEIAPKKLKGCVMRKAKCTVYSPHAPSVFQANWQKRFEVDKAKLTELMIGVNIYDTKLDFLREYIQNALDASKMQLWLDLKNGKYPQYSCNPDILDISQLTPFDIPQAIYDQYMIEIQVDLDIVSQQVLLKIIDHGIGMEEACLDVISRIGLGWRGRKAYSDEIVQMLPWLRPTGGFGIGIQSAFMLTDQLELITRSDKELKTHKLILNSPRTSGLIIEETDTGAGERERGTTIKLKIDLDYFQSWNEEYQNTANTENGNNKNIQTIHRLLGQLNFEGGDVFSEDNTLDYVIKLIEQYMKELIVNSFIPLRITNSKREPVVYRSEYGIPDSYWNYRERYVCDTELLNGQNYRWIYDMDRDDMRIWSEKEAVYTYIKKEKAPRHTACFKNICVVRNTNYNYSVVSEFTMCMDYMGQTAESALKVHRNSFNESFPHEQYVMNGIRIYIKAMQFLEKRFCDVDNQKTYEIIYDNLYNSNIPLIRLLYYKEISEKDWGQHLSAITLNVKNEEESGSFSLGTWHGDIETNKLFEDIKEMLSGNTDKRIYVRCPLSAENGYEMITKQRFMAFMNDMKEGTRSPEFHDYYPVIEDMQEGMQVVNDWEIYDLIYKSNRFECIYFSVDVDGTRLIFAEFFTKNKVENHDIAMDDEEFYKAVFGSSGRPILGMPDAKHYEKLIVSRLPYGQQTVNQGPFLISPVNAEIRLRYPKLSEKVAYKKIYPYDNFVNDVLSDNEFQAVLEWVCENQVSEKKYSKPELTEEYKRFISDIYLNYFLARKTVLRDL